MQAYASIQLHGWDEPRMLRITDIHFKEKHIHSITVDLGRKYIPKYLTFYHGTEEWNEVVKEIIVLNHKDLHPEIRLIEV